MHVHVSKQRIIWLAIASSKQPTFMPNKHGWMPGLVLVLDKQTWSLIVETVIVAWTWQDYVSKSASALNLDDGSA
jgi:hypothetical protein